MGGPPVLHEGHGDLMGQSCLSHRCSGALPILSQNPPTGAGGSHGLRRPPGDSQAAIVSSGHPRKSRAQGPDPTPKASHVCLLALKGVLQLSQLQ